MARIPCEDEIIISRVELHRGSRYLAEILHRKVLWDIEYRFATPIKEGGRVAPGP